MTWYRDLSPCDYFGISDPKRLIAVGWLSKRRRYSRGSVPAEVLSKIERLADHPLHIFVFRGFHICELCGGDVDERLVDVDGNRIPSSSHLNVFVPCGSRILVTPQCLPHYVTTHGYCPPEEFRDAVRACPEPGAALADSLRAAGIPEVTAQLARERELRDVPKN